MDGRRQGARALGVPEGGLTISSIERVGWGILAVAGLLGVIFLSPQATGGLLLGGALGLLNLRVLDGSLGKFLSGKRRRARLRAQLLAPLRYLALGLALYGGLVWGEMNPLALLSGLSVVVVAIAASGLTPRGRRA